MASQDHAQEAIITPHEQAIALVGDPEIDRQVATARRFPRSVTTFVRKATEMATMSTEVAASCIYALPRRENGVQKNVEGPSARFAEICASAYGNLRAEGKVLDHDDQFVTARGTAWDVENNVAIAYEVKRRITDSKGRTYSTDMITVTGNAAASIALRNAILKNIPTTFWKPIYNACRKVIAGDQKTFASRRDAMLHEFAVMGVTEERLLASLGLKGKADITGDHMVQLAGLMTALRDGDTTIDEAFQDGGPVAPQPGQRKSQQTSQPAQTTTPAEGQPASSASTASPSPNVGTIADVIDKGNGAVIVKLSTGFQAGSRDAEVVASLRANRESGRRVELTTKAASDPRFVPVITEVLPLGDGAAQ